MGSEPVFEDDRGRQGIDGGFFSAHPALRGEPFASFDTGQTLIGVVDRENQVRAELISELARCTRNRAFTSIHVEREAHNQLCDSSSIDGARNLVEIFPQ